MEDVIKDEYKEEGGEYHTKVYRSCHEDRIVANEQTWFPRKCCDKHIAFDKREPGLMKLEASGTEMISLSAKTYFLQQPTKFKISCKGVNKSLVKDPLQIYRSVLNEYKSFSVQNRGFRARNNTMWTYRQDRTGFSYFYCKREVLQDGTSTKPLELTLTPWIDYNTQCFDSDSPLGMSYPCELVRFGISFNSASQLFAYMKCVRHADVIRRERVLNSTSPEKAMEISNEISIIPKWAEIRDELMTEILVMKNAQLACVRRYLLEHRGKQFVCIDNSLPSYWSCGCSIRMAPLLNPEKFTGHNRLGQLWTDVSNDVQVINI